ASGPIQAKSCEVELPECGRNSSQTGVLKYAATRGSNRDSIWDLVKSKARSRIGSRATPDTFAPAHPAVLPPPMNILQYTYDTVRPPASSFDHVSTNLYMEASALGHILPPTPEKSDYRNVGFSAGTAWATFR